MPDRPPIGSAALDEAALLMPGLVHEMRQPVMGIKAGLQLLAIFEPLFTTKPPGAGTGLGLHTARRMLRPFGGVVQLLADDAPLRQPWATTEFSVELPAATEEAG